MKIRAGTWETLELFENVLPGAAIRMESSAAYREPVGLAEKVRFSWDRQLREQMQIRQAAHPDDVFEIRPYGDTGLNALYRCGKPDMWPGGAVYLIGNRSEGDGYALEVAQTNYPMITSLSDPAVRTLYVNQKIPIPNKPLGICTVAKTADQKLVLTVRGKTNVYPDRLHVNGGNPQKPMSPMEHQMGETEGEILVRRDEYNPSEIAFFGLVKDWDGLPNKPELTGYVPVNVEYGIIKERVIKREKKPNDVTDVECVDASAGGLADFLANTPPSKFVPPGHANLVLYGLREFGEDWVSDLNRNVGWLQALSE